MNKIEERLLEIVESCETEQEDPYFGQKVTYTNAIWNWSYDTVVDRIMDFLEDEYPKMLREQKLRRITNEL